jgi:NAD(P)-dependent dehydrogenase (short-subunit alcohol dehydrogenase family)
MPVDRPADVPDFAGLLRLDGRSIAVLGAGAGIGRQSVHALVQAGASVVCVDRDPVLAERVAAETGTHAVVADAVSREDLARALDQAVALAGPITGVVDVIGAATLGPLQDVDDARWEQQLNVNLRHAFLAIQLAAPMMAAAGGGTLVFVGSMAGSRAVPGQAVYGVMKAGLHHLVATAGSELASSGIRVNAVAPGWIKTPRMLDRLGDKWSAIDQLIPRGSAAEPWEIASLLLFLTSPLSSYVTGQVLVADGGLAACVPYTDVFG